MIEAVKKLKVNLDEDLRKPSVVVTAPTANAAYIIGGRTIDSTFGFRPSDSNNYVPSDPGQLASMKFQYENVKVFIIGKLFCIECDLSKLHD